MDPVDQIAQLETDLAEFKAASKELESELEAELAASEASQAALRAQLASAQRDAQTWRDRHARLVAEASASEKRLAAAADVQSEQAVYAMQRLRAVEADADDLERAARAFESSLADLEKRNGELLEQLALTSSDRSVLEEQLQRARDELRELRDEIHAQALKAAIEINTVAPPGAGVANSNAISSTVPTSRSLRRVAGMLNQVETIEDHVATVRRRLSTRGPIEVSARRTFSESVNHLPVHTSPQILVQRVRGAMTSIEGDDCGDSLSRPPGRLSGNGAAHKTEDTALVDIRQLSIAPFAGSRLHRPPNVLGKPRALGHGSPICTFSHVYN